MFSQVLHSTCCHAGQDRWQAGATWGARWVGGDAGSRYSGWLGFPIRWGCVGLLIDCVLKIKDWRGRHKISHVAHDIYRLIPTCVRHFLVFMYTAQVAGCQKSSVSVLFSPIVFASSFRSSNQVSLQLVVRDGISVLDISQLSALHKLTAGEMLVF